MPTEEKPESIEKQEKIKKEAKRILDKFAKALEKVKEKDEYFVERDEDRRKEGDGKEGESDFRKLFFENAPNKNKDFILAERGNWK